MVTFFFTPILLKYLGAKNFGTFKVLMELYGHLSLLEFGLSAGVVAGLLPLVRKGDHEQVQLFLSAVTKRFVLSAILTAIVAALLYPFLVSLTSWGEESPVQLRLTYLLIASTAVLIPLKPYQLFIEANNQGYKVNLIIFFQNLVFIACGVLFAFLGWGLISQGIATVVSGILGAFLMQRFSGFRIQKKKYEDPNLISEINLTQRSQVLNDIATKICLNCDQLIISFVLGPVTVAKIFLGQRIIVILQGQLQSIGQSAYASLGALYYSDIESFRLRVHEVTKIISVFAVSLLVPVCLFNKPFISLWIGDELQVEGNLLTYLASGNAFLLGLFSFWSLLFTVLGKAHEITTMTWKQAGVNVSASILCTYLIGGAGPILGTLVSLVVIPLWSYPRLLSVHFGLSERDLFKTILAPFLFGVLCLFSYQSLPFKLRPTSWFSLIFYGGLIALGIFIFFFCFFFRAEERRFFLRRWEALWQRRK